MNESGSSAPLAALVHRWDASDLPRAPARWVVGSGGRSFAIAGLARHSAGPLLVITPGERDAEDLVDDLDLFTDSAVVLPAWETLPFELVSPNAQTMALRARARHRLASGGAGTVVVGSVRAVIQRLSPSQVDPISIAPGMELDVTELARSLAGFGYHRTDRVEGRGEFAVRGGILDVFPAQADTPARIDFWGDEVEELRSFSPGSQRSEEPIALLEIYPARELRPEGVIARRAGELVVSEPWAAGTFERIAEGQMFSGMESWLPWLTEERSILDEAAGATVVLIDPARAKDRGRDLVKEEQDLAEALAPTWGELAPAAGAHPPLFGELDPDGSTLLEMPGVATGPNDPVLEVRGFDAAPGEPDSVVGGLTRLISRGMSVVVAMDGLPAAQRVSRVLAEHGLALSVDDPGGSEATVLATGIHHGFVLPGQAVAVLGEQEIAGRRRSHRRTGRLHHHARQEYRDLTEGDFVVHHQHGIGRFEGLVSRTMAGVEREYLIIGYHGGDRLYVPTDQLAAVTKYTGGETPRVSRMGGKDWSEQRSRVRKAVAAVAQQVVEMHRRRAMATGHSYPPDSPWQREMEDAFPFEETPDQLGAIGDVKSDMEGDKAMDRLVFGDVGFGKTEVAIRAAFKAVQAGKQVAVLCPTTLLAQQHHQTFSDRLASYPVRVEVLSRFLTSRQQKQVVEGLATGEVDVVVGTHRLLSEDVSFKDLGLIVIDEEQRFGVNAKDTLKRLRVGVDVITLTATPIPRTLEMALTGIRDVSHIRTPPEDRHPILTYVGPFDEQAVSAAIRRELLRDGQVFYVHNRVQSIDRAVARLRSLVPDARYAVAHGQMSEGQLEQVMIDFWGGEYD
ncbi:MAG: transcription-repair coupling factor, partial [Acidimicrobiia bacterium]